MSLRRLTVILFFCGASSCGPGTNGSGAVSAAGTTTEPSTSASMTTPDLPTTGLTPTSTGSTNTSQATDSATGSTQDSEAATDGTGDGRCEPVFPPPTCDGDLVEDEHFEPHEVYLAGTVSEGACYRDAVAHWSTPSSAATGFECYFESEHARIRPTDGRLLYTLAFEASLREFHCDACPLAGLNFYPNETLDNDTVLPTPACDPMAEIQPAFLVGGEGQHYYRCSHSEDTWYDADGVVVFVESRVGRLLHVGRCKQALTEGSLVDLESGVATSITGLPPGDAVAIRAAPEGGFWVVKPPEQPGLWHVPLDGHAVDLGLYPPLPDDHSVLSSALDGCGALLQITHSPGSDTIVRRTPGGAAEIVYSEQTDPFVKIHISYLVTGP